MIVRHTLIPKIKTQLELHLIRKFIHASHQKVKKRNHWKKKIHNLTTNLGPKEKEEDIFVITSPCIQIKGARKLAKNQDFRTQRQQRKVKKFNIK